MCGISRTLVPSYISIAWEITIYYRKLDKLLIFLKCDANWETIIVARCITYMLIIWCYTLFIVHISRGRYPITYMMYSYPVIVYSIFSCTIYSTCILPKFSKRLYGRAINLLKTKSKNIADVERLVRLYIHLVKLAGMQHFFWIRNNLVLRWSYVNLGKVHFLHKRCSNGILKIYKIHFPRVKLTKSIKCPCAAYYILYLQLGMNLYIEITTNIDNSSPICNRSQC